MHEAPPPGSETVPLGDRYFRKGLGLRGEVKDRIAGDYHSAIVRRFREEGFTLRVDLEASDDAGEAAVTVTDVGSF